MVLIIVNHGYDYATSFPGISLLWRKNLVGAGDTWPIENWLTKGVREKFHITCFWVGVLYTIKNFIE